MRWKLARNAFAITFAGRFRKSHSLMKTAGSRTPFIGQSHHRTKTLYHSTLKLLSLNGECLGVSADNRWLIVAATSRAWVVMKKCPPG